MESVIEAGTGKRQENKEPVGSRQAVGLHNSSLPFPFFSAGWVCISPSHSEGVLGSVGLWSRGKLCCGSLQCLPLKPGAASPAEELLIAL